VNRPTFAHSAAFFAAAIAIPCSSVLAQQSDVSLSPFVSFLPATGASPMAGLAIMLMAEIIAETVIRETV